MFAGTLDIIVDALGRLRRSPTSILVALGLAEVAVATVLAPIGAASVDWLVRRSGHYAVANEELVGFAASPIGLATLLVAAIVVFVGLQLGRAAGLLAARADGGGGLVGGIVAFVGALRRLPAIAELSARQLLIAGAHAAPFVAALAAIAWFVVRGVEPYWLVNTRPPRLWVGAACAAPIALVGAAFVLRRARGWSIALPLCVLGGRPPRTALVDASRLLGGRAAIAAATRVGWFALCGIAGFVLLAGLHAAAEAALRRELGGLAITAAAAGVVLLGYGAIATIVALVATAGDVLVVFVLWRAVDGGEAEDAAPRPRTPGAATSPRWRRRATAAAAGLAAASAAAGIGAAGLLRTIDQPIDVELTAHRGAAAVAPENTLVAARTALALGADRVEIDAMAASDGAIVVFHDSDLRRIAGSPRRIADMTLEELRLVDVGAWFGEPFAGERIPTLDEVLDATVGRIPLNIELKANGNDTELAAAVATIVRAHGAAGGLDTGADRARAAIVTSLSTRALEAMRRADPSIPIGLIVTASLGDLRRLDVDLLSVDARIATPDFLARAAAANLPVHVWGVHDADLLTRLALRGAAGVITPDVATMRGRLDELKELNDVERLLLAFRTRLVER